MLAVIACIYTAGLLPAAGVHRLGLPGPLCSRSCAITMRTPKVPYKYPGMESPQWIDVYNRMYRERIMFLGQPISDNLANTIISVLLYLESEDAKAPVAMYLNCYGGMMKSGLAVYDTMRVMPYDMQCVNMGMC